MKLELSPNLGNEQRTGIAQRHGLRMLPRSVRGLNGRFWHRADMPTAPAFVRYWSNSGYWPELALNALVANDPTATLAVDCGNCFDASFSHYQSTRLSRYNAVA
jgi:hypothetical protein